MISLSQTSQSFHFLDLCAFLLVRKTLNWCWNKCCFLMFLMLWFSATKKKKKKGNRDFLSHNSELREKNSKLWDQIAITFLIFCILWQKHPTIVFSLFSLMKCALSCMFRPRLEQYKPRSSDLRWVLFCAPEPGPSHFHRQTPATQRLASFLTAGN